MPKRKREKAKSSFDSEKRRSEAAAFFISLKGINRDDKAVRVNYVAREKKGSTKKLKAIMAVLAVVMLGVVSAGIYLVYQEFEKLGPPVQQTGASAVSSPESASSAVPEDPDDHLLAVGNGKLALPEEFQTDLTEYEGISVDSQMVPFLQQMIEAAAEQQVVLTVDQGYLSNETIQKNYDDQVAANMAGGMSKARAEAAALQSSPPPGWNEWGTGLLVCFANTQGGDFSQTDAYRWLNDYCVNYGFVLRYPENKTDATGMNFQPQVFRFVGVEHAQKMRTLAFCLEEYASYVEDQKSGY